MRQHIYRVFVPDIKSRFTFGESNKYSKRCGVSKYYFHGFVEPFAIYVFSNDSSFLNTPIFAQKENSIKKAPPTKVEGFQILPFNLNQTFEISFTENC